MKSINPKKSLGQNFLTDKNIINIIVDRGNINKKDIILEVGPGTGSLTEKILSKNPKKVFAIEKDKYLSKDLSEKFKEKLIIINEDILKFDEKKLSNQPMIVFGNLPYNISTQIFIKWIKLINLNKTFKKLILMFQKEVAERIIAKKNTKNYGRLSIISNWRLDIKNEFDISKNCFFPKPKVESTLLSFLPKVDYFKIKNPKNLEKITRVFFNQRRKMIKNPLRQIFKNPELVAKKIKLNLNLRPQNLSPLDYYKLTREYENLTN